MKISILVEGRTERAFFPHLRAFLEPRLAGQMPWLVPIVYDGRIPKEDKLRRVVTSALSGPRASNAVIALTDVYTGTNDFLDAQDAKLKMSNWVGGIPSFFPHVALHDFESWLIPYWTTIQRLAHHNRASPGAEPETINHNKPPSAYLREIFEAGAVRDSYNKVRDAGRILRGQDLHLAIQSCSELKALVNRIVLLVGGQAIA